MKEGFESEIYLKHPSTSLRVTVRLSEVEVFSQKQTTLNLIV